LNAGGRRAGAPPEDGGTSGSCLLVFPGALGDFLCFLPTADALRGDATSPTTLIARAAFRPLLGGRFAFIDIDRREVAALFASEHDAVIETFFGRFQRSFSWSGGSDPNVRRNLAAITDGPSRVFTFDDFHSGTHAADRFAHCAGVAAGPTRVALEDDARRWARALATEIGLDAQTLVLHPGSGSAGKNWQGMPALARQWRGSRGKVVAIVGPADAEIGDCDAVIRDQPVDRIAAFLEISPMFVGNDSGISHLAAAVSCTGVALFADTDPTIWRPRGESIRVVHTPSSCDECGPNRFCTHRLAVVDVLKQVDRVRHESYRPRR